MTTGDVSRSADVARYDGAAEGWARGASLVYGPLAFELVARSVHPLTGRSVLDVGAGTGVGSTALRASGARPIALDLSHDMLLWDRANRPPSAVADVLAVPVKDGGVDDVFASFVLNHVAEPIEGIRELARTARSGGAFLVSTYANESRSAARDCIDVVTSEHGWQAPDWYVRLKGAVAPLLGSGEAMEEAAANAGLVDVVVDEGPIDVGVHRAEQLVDYRLGQAHISEYLRTLPPDGQADLRAAAIAAVEPVMQPYCPIVVFLSARVP